ncbi:MAG: FkbM family methyltransferase [Candidatus Pacearchaeota archaeon]
MREFNIPNKFDFVKIDVEGAEMDVLKLLRTLSLILFILRYQLKERIS